MFYLHVPFCRSFCTYCDFYSELCPKTSASTDEGLLFNEYADAVVAELGARKEEMLLNSAASPSTLYIGGGTPSVLPPDVLHRLVRAVEDAVKETDEKPECGVGVCRGNSGPETGLSDSGSPVFSEFTVEVNPEDIVEKGTDYVCFLLGLGVNRISMGVQSFDDGILRWMNRRHTASRAKEAFDVIRRAEKIADRSVSVSIDLIFGLSDLSDALWESTISQALALGSSSGFRGPEHISAYQLSVEEGSALARLVEKGLYKEASEEQCFRQYCILCSRLSDAGFRHYEISNFALPGFEAEHNSAYWKRVPYIGLGPGAHSLSFLPSDWFNGKVCAKTSEAVANACLLNDSGSKTVPQQDAEGNGPSRSVVEDNDGKSGLVFKELAEVRFWNSQELPERQVGGGLTAYSQNYEILSEEDVRVEELMLALRTADGLEEERFRSIVTPGAADRLISEGALELFTPAAQAPGDSSRVQSTGWVAGPGCLPVPRIRIPESRLFTSDEIIRELV